MSDTRTYELTIVVPTANAAAESKVTPLEDITALLKKLKATVNQEEEWGEKTLAYPVKKYLRGLYQHYLVEMKPGTANKLKEELKHIPGVLRWLLVTAEEKAE